MKFKTIIFLIAGILIEAAVAFAAPSTASVSGTLYSGSGKPLANATMIFNTPQQIIGGSVIAPTIFSTRTNSSGAITPITLVQSAVVQITINSGMVITGVVPASSTADINAILSGTQINTASAIQVNGTPLLSTVTINFQNGTGTTVSNPSAGNIQVAAVPGFDQIQTGTNTTATMLVGTGASITFSASGVINASQYKGFATVRAVDGGTGLTAGTSGGIPYFSSTTTIASSALLTANLPVIGGGAGAAPAVGTRSGNTTRFVSMDGSTPATNDCAKFDANLNLTTAGACAGTGTLGGASASANADQTITTATFTAVAFNTENYDTNTYHDNSTNNSRFTVPATGIYMVTGTVTWAAAFANGVQTLLRVNGTNYVTGEAVQGNATTTTALGANAILSLTAADYVELIVWQNSGSNKDIDSVANYSPVFQIERLR